MASIQSQTNTYHLPSSSSDVLLSLQNFTFTQLPFSSMYPIRLLSCFRKIQKKKKKNCTRDLNHSV